MFLRLIQLISFILAVFLLSCTSGPKKDERAAYNHFRLGVSLLAQNHKEKALEQLLLAKQLDPENEMIHNHLGLAYFALREYEHSILALKEAVDLEPSFSEAHNNLGRVYIEIKDFAKARKHLGIAAADLTYANRDKVWLNLGLSYFLNNQYKQSENYFLKSISMNRNNCLGYNYYGRVLIELEEFKKASRALDQAIYHCRRKGFDEPHYYSGISFFRMGYKAKAIARLQEGRKKFPSGPNRRKIDEMINLMRLTDTQ
jgi:type IV pilus assembly protein PilF